MIHGVPVKTYNALKNHIIVLIMIIFLTCIIKYLRLECLYLTGLYLYIIFLPVCICTLYYLSVSYHPKAAHNITDIHYLSVHVHHINCLYLTSLYPCMYLTSLYHVTGLSHLSVSVI